MNPLKFCKSFIKKLLPKFLYKRISDLLHEKDIFTKQSEWAFMNWNKIWKNSVFPYSWANEYELEEFPCKKDITSGMFYIENRGLKLFFPQNYKKESCQNEALSVSLEQDLFSAHRYVSKENRMFGTLERAEDEIQKHIPHFVEQGDIVADIGASCGNFSLSVIENAKHIYLFEANENWIKPLYKTFERYNDKITIINKFVSDIDSENTITLDTFFKDKAVNFIKVDVDGYEQQVLNGAKHILSGGGQIKCSICIYHRSQDEKDFEKFFKEFGYETNFSNSHMFFPIDWKFYLEGIPQPQNMSFFRKGVIMSRRKKEI